MLLEAQNIVKSYGIQELFRIPRLEIGEGARIGLVGLNGCGKSTLLKILCGLAEPDEGVISRNCEIALIGQEADPDGASSGLMLSRMNLRDSACKSGGEKTRLAIAAAFSRGTRLLFADEPTTNLDMKGMETLGKMLRDYQGGLVLVSHDRFLLDEVCTEIWEIEDGGLRMFPGTYSMWAEQKERERNFAQFEFQQYQTEKRRLETTIRQVKEEARRMVKPPKRMGSSEWMLYKGTAAVQQGHVQSRSKAMEKRLDHLEAKEKPKELPKVAMRLGCSQPLEGKTALRVKHLTVKYGKHLAVDNAQFTLAANQCTVMLGDNGAGKSTLLHRIMEEDPAVTLVGKVKIGYFSQEHEILDKDKSVLENVRAASVLEESVVRAVLANLYLTARDVGKPVGVLSGGERAKTQLAKLLTSGANLLILDEPTNHIDLYTTEALENLLKQWEGTMLIVTHDRKLAQNLADRLLFVEKGRVTSFEGTWQEWEEEKKRKNRSQDQDAKKLSKILLSMKMTELEARLRRPQKGDCGERIREELERVTREYYKEEE